MKLLATFLTVASLCAVTPELQRAQGLYQHTSYADSLRILNAIPQKDAATWSLIGRNHYMLGDYKKATEALEKAVAQAPGVSEYCLWLGRAWGRRAETSSPLTAPGHAGRARTNFERAVQLAARNMDAMGDLFEYYLEAPGFLGGGMDKAERMAEKIAKLDAAEGYLALAKLAEKRKDSGQAEQYLRQAGRMVELAKFLSKQKRFAESDQAFDKAFKMAPDGQSARFSQAEAYVNAGRRLDEARKMLQGYITSQGLTPDDPSRAEAEKLLKKIGR